MTIIKLAALAAAMLLFTPAWAGYSAQHDTVQLHFQSDEEKTAKDTTWTAPDIFKIGVLDNGRNRDGYAEYACMILYDHDFKGKRIWVQIIDIARLVRTQEWVKLGEAHCI